MLRFTIFFSIFILLVAGVVYFVFYSHFLLVAGVEISGSAKTEEIKNALIGNLAGTSKIRRLLGSDNLLFWSPKAIRQIPSSLYWLKDVKIERNWQDKKITINVKEREPWILWRMTASGNCYWIDEEGIVFSPAPAAEGFIIAKMSEQGDRQQLLFGQLFDDNPQFAENTLEIIKQLKDSSLAVSRFSIQNSNLDELTAETNGLKLYFSSRFSLRNFDGILTDLAGRLDFSKLEYIDFRVENRIYYK